MKKFIVNENERGLYFKNGKFKKVLMPNRYIDTKNKMMFAFGLDKEIILGDYCSVDVLMKDKTFSKMTIVCEVNDEEIALHFIDGRYAGVLKTGKHAFWKEGGEHKFIKFDVSTPYVDESFPMYVFNKLPVTMYEKIVVKDYEKARLYFDKKFVKMLDGGIYYFWKNNTKIDCEIVDTRLMEKNITGQEILTMDKVSLRINCVCTYRITDYVKIATEIDDFEEQLHTYVQLTLRDYVGKHKLDEILENKEELSCYVLKRLKEKEQAFYIEIENAGVKDIILPGEIRNIMNMVLIAEKQAQANVITRREEVASTRSLLNTARLMDENKTLYKLKELEYMEKICENVGNINIESGSNVITQLSALFGKG